MNRLVAIESPISAVASSVASTKSQASAPAAASIDSRSVLRREGEVGMAGEVAGDGLVRVDDGVRGAGLQPGQRIGAGGDDEVAAQQQVGAAGAEAHGMQRLGRGADADMADHRAALLRHAGLVEHGDALAFEVRRHAQDGADGDDAGAADAGDQHAVGLVADRRQDGRGRQRRSRPSASAGLLSALPLRSAAAFDGDEARAEAVEAGEVLVAGRLVDGALAAELGLDRRRRERQFDCTEQSPQPSQTAWLMNTRLAGSGKVPRLRRRRFSAAQVWS